MKPEFMNEYNHGYQSQADCVAVLQLNKIKENQRAYCLRGALTTFQHSLALWQFTICSDQVAFV